MSNSATNDVTYPVTKGTSLSNIQRSFCISDVPSDSKLELQLEESSLEIFDELIQASRSKSGRSGDQVDPLVYVRDDVIFRIDPEESTSTRKTFVEETRKLRGISYLKRKKIFELFNFFTVQLLNATPNNPIDFLVELLNQCLLFREQLHGSIPPPLLFSDDHVQTICLAFDPLKTGFITMQQYKEAMKTLGFVNCEETEEASYLAKVPITVFIADAKRRLASQLRALIHVPDTS